MLKTYRGACHCRRTRFWAAVARPEGFRLLAGERELTQYLFGSKKNEHPFCRRCGVRAFGVGNDTPIGLEITYVDGLHDRWDSPPAAVRQL